MALVSRVRLRYTPHRCFRRLFSSSSIGHDISSDEGSRVELWTWGKNEVGQLGLGDEETRRSPTLVTSMVHSHCAALARTEGRLPVAASSSEAEGGKHSDFTRKDDRRSESSMRPISASRTVVDEKVGIACGLFHSGLWAGGKVWLWGKGGGGRLGLGSEENRYSPTQLSRLTDIKSLALGGLHSVAVSHGGSVYTWGFGGFGALGHGIYTKEMSPRKLTGEDWMENVVQVSAGGSHTAAVTSSGELYTWGRDEGEGRLGHGWAVETDEGVLSTPVKVQELRVPVAAVACGGFCTMALTLGGQLWSWGGNSNYELGRGNRKDDWRPKPIRALENEQIIQVACGGYHAAALTEAGEVLTWGHGGHGQLGHGGLESAKEPTVVESLVDQKVVAIACGGAWTTAVTRELRATAERGRKDFASFHHLEKSRTPSNFLFPTTPQTITHIPTIGSMPVSLADLGEVYAWGKNRDNQLGMPGLSDAQMSPAVVDCEGFYKVSQSQNRRVIGVCAGATHGMCLVHAESI